MKKPRNNFFFKLTLLLIFACGVWLRLFNLGYSDMQGDEVSAQNFLFDDKNFSQFLLYRTNGPGQFVVSCISNKIICGGSVECFTRKISPPANSELYLRLPYTLASIACLFVFYKLVEKTLGKRTGLMSLAFISLSGLLVAFGRIIQYQSFVLLFSVLAVLLVKIQEEKNRNIYLVLAGLTSGISLLFHYDSLSFIFPIFIFLVLRKSWRGLIYYLVPTALIPALYYTPFLVFNPSLKGLFQYVVGERLVSNYSFDAVYYTLQILQVYHSPIFLVAAFLGIVAWVLSLFKKFDKTSKIILLSTLGIMLLRATLKNRVEGIVYISWVLYGIFTLQYFAKLKNRNSSKNILPEEKMWEIWFLFSFGVYTIFISKPLTHIYTFLLPMFALSANQIENLLGKGIKEKARGIVFATIIVASLSFNYQAFIESKTEYPWEPEKYIFGNMYLGVWRGKIKDGIFGFPYNRSWKEIATVSQDLAKKYNLISYNTNEKNRISKYYMQNFKFNDQNPDFLIYIRNPQSMTGLSQPNIKPEILTKNYSIYILTRQVFQ